MRVSASIHDVAEQGRNLCRIPKMDHDGGQRQIILGRGKVQTDKAMSYNWNG
jgi:hypothetical protein